ncbi:MAG: hypothetical protein GTO03_04270, partial [Planctomycetales bacterium]|nr:hypothetical protein [Planctomycetales bacterium]
GVTSVLGSEEGKQLRNPDFQFRPPVEALPPVVARLQAEKCDLLILLANATIEEAQQLARQFPAFDYCLAAGDS